MCKHETKPATKCYFYDRLFPPQFCVCACVFFFHGSLIATLFNPNELSPSFEMYEKSNIKKRASGLPAQRSFPLDRIWHFLYPFTSRNSRRFMLFYFMCNKILFTSKRGSFAKYFFCFVLLLILAYFFQKRCRGHKYKFRRAWITVLIYWLWDTPV